MASTSSCDPKVLMAKGKRATATYIHADCSNERNPQHLNEVLDNLLNPQKSIEEWETIDWCKWLMAGGRTPDEFASTVRAYDNATTCGLVWTPNFVAYRCRTCGISPCMSLCTECFKKGNHARHDFNMFLSQAGGACDCGDASVMKETGFCERHGPNKRSTKGQAPTDLMCVAEAMMPRIILRLIQHLRENSRMGTADAYKGAIQDADAFITMLSDFNNMGGLMRKVITTALTNPQKYRVLNEIPENPTTEYEQYLVESRRKYEEALESLPNPEPIENLVHKTFLEELVFWTVKFEFPQKIVCLLLNMLPDSDYKVYQKESCHYVVDCAKPVMKDHCYWPLVSDLKNVLSHRPVALKFMSDDDLLERWFVFLSMFQVMNVNQRELHQHIEFEPNTYYAAFSAELEASAYPMWALISHLTDASTAHLTKRVLNACLNELKDWFHAIAYLSTTVNDSLQVSFHLPLHRYLAVFLSQAVAIQGVTVNEVLGSSDFFLDLLMMHPLRIQVAFYEILNGLWLRNGLQIKGQAMTYIQCNFCNSMVDADLYLLQICCTRLPSEKFLNIVIEKFHIKEWMSLAPFQGTQSAYIEGEHDTPMLESFLTFLATLISVRTNLGLSDTSLNRLEMVTLLCMGDKTHSQLMELMPERCGMSESRDFESLLAEVAFYRAPALEASGNMQQGMYVPKPEIWEKQYDPIHVLLRAVHRRDFQTSMDRYTEFARHANKLKPGCSLWPPFRTPTEVAEAYDDPRQILKSRVFHAAALIILFKAVRGHVSEHVMALVVFLLEQAVLIAAQEDNKEDSKMCSTAPPQSQVSDMDLASWFTADSVFDNLKTVIGQVIVHPEPDFSLITYSSDSDLDWDSTEIDAADSDTMLMLDQAHSNNNWDGEGQEQSESREVMVFRPQAMETISPVVETPPTTPRLFALPSTTHMPMEVDRIMSLAVRETTPSVTDVGTPSPTETPALPPPDTRPVLLAGNEVGRTVRKTTKTPGASGSSSRTGTELVPTTSQGHRKSRSNTPLRVTSNFPPVVKVNESLISLLLRLHSQLSGVPDSYNPDDEEGSSSSVDSADISVGDGIFYIARLLKKISSLDENCKNYIQETRLKLWPSKEEREEAKKQRENREREERRRRAKERQQKLMQEFANKQKQFMEKAMECDDAAEEEEEEEEEEVAKQQEYDCVICNQSSPSTEEQPMGLVVLIQATSIIGHMRRHDQPERSVLPTCEEEQSSFFYKDDRGTSLGAEYDRRIDELDRHFDPVQKLCLPFLRIAALLKHHLYQQPLPDIFEANNEFVRLVYYLELVTESMDWGWFNASVALTWSMDMGLETKTPRAWCEQLGVFVGKSQLAAKGLLAEQHILWYPPRLLQLPREYEKIFTYYHERPCRQCQSVAQETSICLLCGTIVCLKQNCCKQQNVCEAVAHAAECGAGTGIFLVVTSTYIIVIRGHRACLWGSLYLDDFEEEDRDLKRGKPLYLSTARYKLLEQQWLAHRFDHTEKTWVPHRNAL
uniref:E3 ubiquitin-protein ligase n=1 Tax=Diabrotica virgifera virgifera TaxID=50390 RepID=A0A6P7GK94_DIAVI